MKADQRARDGEAWCAEYERHAWRVRGIPLYRFGPLFVAFVQIGGTYGTSKHNVHAGSRTIDAFAWVLTVIGPVALLFARRHPRAVIAVTTAVVLTYSLRGYPEGPIYVSYAAAVVQGIMWGYRWEAYGSLPVLFIGHYVIPPLFAGAHWPALSTFGQDVAWSVAVLAIAELSNFRRQRIMAGERTREERASRRAADERLAIARELHDVLAHSISLINVQAGTALEVMDRRPEQARIALEAIKLASREALGEVRSVLGVLRSPDGNGSTAAAPLRPTAGLARLDELVEGARAAGLKVRILTEGEIRPLPAGVDLAAYRIVQEALTNVVRHAHADEVEVHVGYGERGVHLMVADDGRGGAVPVDEHLTGGGNGLPGMRERATALGGVLTAGPRPGGGFVVEAELPTEGVR
jgi:signal transduction histidine kinase